jgi:hypothetical protein
VLGAAAGLLLLYLEPLTIAAGATALALAAALAAARRASSAPTPAHPVLPPVPPGAGESPTRTEGRG